MKFLSWCTIIILKIFKFFGQSGELWRVRSTKTRYERTHILKLIVAPSTSLDKFLILTRAVYKVETLDILASDLRLH